MMDDTDIEAMCEDLYSPIAGAREIIGIMGKTIKPSISKKIITGTLESDIVIKYDREARKIII